MIGNCPAVFDFNQLLLKLNRLICNQLPVLPDLGLAEGGAIPSNLQHLLAIWWLGSNDRGEPALSYR